MIYLSIGSNIGNRRKNLANAVFFLKNRIFKNLKCSIILETECILLPESPKEWDMPFLNMIVWGECDLSPENLLKAIKEIEHEMGRPKFYEKWAPRIIDIDILFFNNITIDTPTLKIPHPEIHNRPFLQHLLSLSGHSKFTSSTHPEVFLKSFTLAPKLVGIINVTPDSFSDGGIYLDADNAVARAIEMANEGADIIEIGAQSTRPGAKILALDQEYDRLKPVLAGLRNQKNLIEISIDSFCPIVIKKVLKEYQVDWINDVKGDLDDSTLRLIADHNCGIILMHSLSVPPTKDLIIDPNLDPIDVILNWGEAKLKKLHSLGFNSDKIILDPGLGFSKSIYQNMQIIQNVSNLKNLGCKIMVGHSRKSFMAAFTNQAASKRDIETIAISAALKNKVDYLRVHNVRDHMRFFVAQNCLNNGDYA